jgi:hypothetical protein
VVLLLAVVGRTCALGSASIDQEVRRLAAQDRVLTIAGGDVSLRDVPKTHEIRSGRFFADPYYAGERHWYPFLTSTVAAAIAGVTGSAVPVAFFRAEVGFVALYLAGLAVLAFVAFRWRGLLALPVVVWLGALHPGNGLYPIEAVRGGLCLFLAGAALCHEREPGWRHAAGLGLAIGLLGLWNGAAFALAGAVTAVLMAIAARRWIRERRPRACLRLVPLLAAALPLALLFAPQWLRHGRLAVPEAARVWSADIYQGATLWKAFTLPLAPRGLHLVFFLAVLARLLGGRRLRLPSWPRVVPLVLAYTGALFFAHLGFVAADRTYPLFSRAARGLLLAPAHTFLAMAEACRPVVAVAGLVAIAELAGAAWRRFGRAPWPGERLAPLVPALSLVACAALVFTFPYRITRFEASESRAFDRFARDVGARLGGAPVFFRYPGRFVQSSSIKILKLSVAEYANPYAHAERTRAERAIDEALRTGQVATADALLDQYGIAHVMEDPRAPADPVIRRCGGPVLIEHEGYRLRRRAPCQR